MVYCSLLCLSVLSTLGGTLALRAQTWVSFNETSKNKHHCAVHIPKNKIQAEVKQFLLNELFVCLLVA